MSDDKDASHGPFEEQSKIAQALKLVMRSGRNWDRLGPESKEALEMTATQIARILTGDPDAAQHWERASGYLGLRGGALQTVESGIARITQRMRPHVLDTYEGRVRQPTPNIVGPPDGGEAS